MSEPVKFPGCGVLDIYPGTTLTRPQVRVLRDIRDGASHARGFPYHASGGVHVCVDRLLAAGMIDSKRRLTGKGRAVLESIAGDEGA